MADDDSPQMMSDVTRRALLGGTAAGAAGLAGCSGGGGGDGGGDGTPTQTPAGDTTQETGTAQGTPTKTTTEGPLPNVEGQTLTWYTMQDPQAATWMGTGVFPGAQGKYRPQWVRTSFQLAMQAEARGPWINQAIKTGEFHSEIYESIDIEPGAVTVKIRDDAKWSNGDHITAPDAMATNLAFRLLWAEPAFEDVQGVPPIANRAVTDYEIVSDKEYKFLTMHDVFDDFIPSMVWTSHVWQGYGWGGIRQNTKIEPFDEWWAAIQDWWEMAKNGELKFWKGPDTFNIFNATKEALFGDEGWSKNPDKNNYDLHWEKHFSKPENAVVTSAWQPKAVNGTQSITYEPNPHHYAVDEVNFDEVKLVARPSERANRSALKADSQDYYRGTVPQYIVKSFPDTISQRMAPSNGGLCFGCDHMAEPFDTVEGRQAIMYAIDKARIARSVHRTKYDPVETPGAHAWGAREMLGKDWISNNLQSYKRDLDKANQKMQAAGYHKEGGNWVDDEGNTVSITIPTASSTPKFAPAFANQLSQFGIDASLQTYSAAIFSEKKQAGDLDIFRTNFGVGFPLNVGRVWYMALPRTPINAFNIWRAWPKEQLLKVWTSEKESATLKHGTNNWKAWKELKTPAPPVGEPDGELKDWQSASLSFKFQFPNSQQQYTDLYKELSWLFNYRVPMFPVANGMNQNFLDTAHWIWPAKDSSVWDGVGVGALQAEDVVSWGQYVSANPDNPEQGASVESN